MAGVAVSRDGSITTVTLNRPEAMNAFDTSLAADVADAVAAAAGDRSCRVIVLTGAGRGASLALACDVRIASADASIGAVFNRIGLHPDLGATYLLPLLAGFGRAMELVLSGEMIPAPEAHRIGLFNRVVAGDALLGETYAFARKLAAKAPHALERARRSMHAAVRLSLDDTLALELDEQLGLLDMDETRDALLAFIDKAMTR